MPTSNEIRSALSDLPRGEMTKIARELGVHPKTVSAWKLGHRFPDWDMALLLLEALIEREAL